MRCVLKKFSKTDSLKLRKEGNIEIKWNHTLHEVTGNQTGVTGIVIKDVNTDNATEIDLQGVFIAIGHKPNTQIFEPFMELDNGYIVTGHNHIATQTSIPGVYAAGDVADPIYRQAITSAGTGCMAALDAEKYLDHL